ncbi:division/cell wall cluster transcriptional repressor MraZ [Alcanivorax sp. 1008]|jgi:MraZ protein|uniref:division/cell wall cluster transcriptional repressor MraZ n=1 Tax=Alcanivorax sp. 1008 TaxID=2816853 RepID=UPI001DF39399|nr:division/cell wall cluster transcriptional repressor MraZ [Alcanivorax sp. 1008]MCC1495263.1 division/cell wall cluster transcriptional repressor MraZ [Alcanivorax sp. 1008]MDF1630543.1 division/cell wall cluster transcriptional repressor MraZ [Alcanivoracaceae bacterium]
MFTGRTALSLDAKGRMAIPARHREKLIVSCGGRVVLTQYPFDPCLALYSEPQWEVIANQVAGLSDAEPAVRKLKRLFLGQAVEMELDSSGRILVPPELRGLINLDRKAMLVGVMRRFEIWEESAWIASNETLDLAGELPDSINALAF